MHMWKYMLCVITVNLHIFNAWILKKLNFYAKNLIKPLAIFLKCQLQPDYYQVNW